MDNTIISSIITDEDISFESIRHLSSPGFIIETPSIIEMEQHILDWIKFGNCGAIIHGSSRMGKTKSILYMKKRLKELYGERFPVLVLNMTDHKPTYGYGSR